MDESRRSDRSPRAHRVDRGGCDARFVYASGSREYRYPLMYPRHDVPSTLYMHLAYFVLSDHGLLHEPVPHCHRLNVW